MNPVAYLPQSKRLQEQVSEVLRYKLYNLKPSRLTSFVAVDFENYFFAKIKLSDMNLRQL